MAFLGSCATTETLYIPSLSQVTSAELQQKVLLNLQKLDTFEGRARVIVELPGHGYNGFAHVLVKPPDSVYVKTEAIFGIDIGALFLDNRYFAAYAPRENTLYYGDAKSLDLQDFLQVEIEREQLVEVFTGLDQLQPESSSTLSEEDGKFVLTGKLAEGVKKFWVDPARNVVVQSELRDAAGTIILKKEFQRFKKKDGVYLPQLIKLTRPLAKERLTLVYTRQKVNKEVAPGEFKVRTSKNAKKIFWRGSKTRRNQSGQTHDRARAE